MLEEEAQDLMAMAAETINYGHASKECVSAYNKAMALSHLVIAFTLLEILDKLKKGQ